MRRIVVKIVLKNLFNLKCKYKCWIIFLVEPELLYQVRDGGKLQKLGIITTQLEIAFAHFSYSVIYVSLLERNFFGLLFICIGTHTNWSFKQNLKITINNL